MATDLRRSNAAGTASDPFAASGLARWWPLLILVVGSVQAAGSNMP